MCKLLIALATCAAVIISFPAHAQVPPQVAQKLDYWVKKGDKIKPFGAVQSGDNQYWLFEGVSDDGQTAGLLLYRYNAASGEVKLIRTGETLFPMNPYDKDTPDLETRRALALVFVKATSSDPVAARNQFQHNPKYWDSLPEEMKYAYTQIGSAP